MHMFWVGLFLTLVVASLFGLIILAVLISGYSDDGASYYDETDDYPANWESDRD